MRTFGPSCPPDGEAKFYRKTAIVRMWRVDEPFACQSREGVLSAQPGDYVAEDGHGGYYPVSAEFHAANYEEAADAAKEE